MEHANQNSVCTNLEVWSKLQLHLDWELNFELPALTDNNRALHLTDTPSHIPSLLSTLLIKNPCLEFFLAFMLALIKCKQNGWHGCWNQHLWFTCCATYRSIKHGYFMFCRRKLFSCFQMKTFKFWFLAFLRVSAAKHKSTRHLSQSIKIRDLASSQLRRKMWIFLSLMRAGQRCRIYYAKCRECLVTNVELNKLKKCQNYGNHFDTKR